MNSPHHPVWFLFNLLALLVITFAFAWWTADSFDETEAKMIGGIFVAWFGYESLKWKFRK